MVNLVSVDALRVELTVPEGDVNLVKQGMPITFRLASGSRDTVFQGRVRYIGPAVRQQTRDAVVEAATVVRAARPTAAPICRLQLTSPDARPASSCGTPPVARSGRR